MPDLRVELHQQRMKQLDERVARAEASQDLRATPASTLVLSSPSLRSC